jgi:tRNA(Ile)-lysidine synthase
VRLATRQPDLDPVVGEVLDRRLQREDPRPVALALSGGGDSLALLLASAAWANRGGRRLLVLTVDHGLRPESRDWTLACAALAGRLSLDFRALAWTSEKPVTGLPAAARAARHGLLADAARNAGARVILMGHTADDVLEARLMREAGSTTPEPREWSPSPVWPAGRGLFLLRPLLAVGRREIRRWLGAQSETWIEDPANADQAYARPRAREVLARRQTTAPVAPQDDRPAQDLALACRPFAGGRLELDRDLLRQATPMAARRFVGTACVCAAGSSRPPSPNRVQNLRDRLTGAADVTATLAGARIEADATHIRFLREVGEASRGGLAPLAIAAGDDAVWDGRFEITTERAIEVRRLAGLANQLSPHDQQALRTLPPSVRPALPVVIDAAGRVACPVLSDVRGVALTPLGHARLLAACGVVEREPT